MTDPRAHIARTVIAPPTPSPAIPPPSTTPLPAAISTGGKLIGKRHGNMRSVGLLLTVTARDELYRLAAQTGLTLGETLVDALRERHTPALLPAEPHQSWLPDRGAPRIRRGADTKATYVLLTPDEARAVSAAAESCHQSVSDFISRVLTR